MEKIINKLIEEFTTQFKDDIKDKMTSLNIYEKEKVNELLLFIYDYNRLTLQKEDLIKTKRNKSDIPAHFRCTAKRVDGEQCTRRKNKDCEFCGTHIKSLPSGTIDEDENEKVSIQSMNVFAEDIQGIVYYIDRFLNVYNTADILEGKEDPKIIAKATKKDNRFTIPEFGLL
jgi:hypothetical protein